MGCGLNEDLTHSDGPDTLGRVVAVLVDGDELACKQSLLSVTTEYSVADVSDQQAETLFRSGSALSPDGHQVRAGPTTGAGGAAVVDSLGKDSVEDVE